MFVMSDKLKEINVIIESCKKELYSISKVEKSFMDNVNKCYSTSGTMLINYITEKYF